MNHIAIQLKNLGKVFGRGKHAVQAVKELNLEVAAGQVYGFLGPNGAGKSTTIRMIMDLIRPTQGEALVFGRSVRRDHQVLHQVGALVEGAMFYDFLTGRQNLEVLAHTGGQYNTSRIQTLLEQVGIADRADRPVKGYSTGMRQRLGLAAALLNDPQLIILDEPTNGLDPAGIQEMRLFIRTLVEQAGKTVFLSSHLLSEVEQLCDRVAIIAKGEVLKEGAVGDLLATQSRLRLEVEPIDKAVSVLQADWTVHPNGTAVTVEASREVIPYILQRLVERDVNVYQVAIQRQSLEEYFMTVTANRER